MAHKTKSNASLEVREYAVSATVSSRLPSSHDMSARLQFQRIRDTNSLSPPQSHGFARLQDALGNEPMRPLRSRD
jgi:hypothetical protein